MQGTYSDLTTAAPAFSDGLNEIIEIADISSESNAAQNTETKITSQILLNAPITTGDTSPTIMENSFNHIDNQGKNISLKSKAHSTSSSCSSSISSNISRRRAPPRHRLSCVIPGSGQGSELDTYVRPPRQKKIEKAQITTNKEHVTVTPTTVIECQDITNNTNKWPSESSGIYTASSHCHTPSGSNSTADVAITSPNSSSRVESDKNESCCGNEKNVFSKHNEQLCYGSTRETNTSITSCTSLTTSASSQSCCYSMSNTTPATEGICYSCCDADCSKGSLLPSGGSSRTSLDPSLSSLNSSVSYTCSSVISPSTSQSCCSTSKGKQIAEASDAVDLSQEWRRGRTSKKDVLGRKCPRPVSTCAAKLDEKKLRTFVPFMPNEKADIWSFGCLLVEALTGRKMFSASDKMASVLRPLQLLEMRIGETECRYHAMGDQEDGKIDRHKFFADAKHLIQG